MWRQLRAVSQADGERLRSVISPSSSSFLYFWSCGQLTKPLAEPWPGVKLTEQDVGNWWAGHEKLLAREIRTDKLREIPDKGWILQVAKEVLSERWPEVTNNWRESLGGVGPGKGREAQVSTPRNTG